MQLRYTESERERKEMENTFIDFLAATDTNKNNRLMK